MRFAFLGHSHHRTTGSSSFFLDLLRARGAVEVFWDASWLEGGELDLAPVLEGGFDALVVWQVEALAGRLAALDLPNVTFVPMYDGCHAMPDGFWRSLSRLKVLSFSSTLFERLQRLGVRSRHARYFPDPGPAPAARFGDGLEGYFWQRQQDVTWRTVRPLLGDTAFRRFTLHRALDPAHGELVPPTAEELRRLGIRFTEWFPDRAAQRRDLAAHNVYFAPRLREGIGLSFLEAMALGMAVVAPDRPTMNEYLVSGVNGLLYDPDDPRPLDLSRAAALGERARAAVEAGREAWLRCVPRVLDLVATPAARVPVDAPLNALDPEGLPRTAAPARPRPRPEPASTGRRVTVAVVTRNAEASLASTLDSILAQDWPDLEVIVQDGASTDGTPSIIRDYASRLDGWRSEPDGGPYEAMNAAVRAASGRFVLFMNAGDHFHATDAVRRAMADVPDDATVVFGHHVYRDLLGVEELHSAAHFDETWRLLRAGRIGWRWLSRVPGHQATFTAVDFLRAHPYRTDLRIAADHELLYRAARSGARFHHSGTVVANYAAGGYSWRNRGRCFEEWAQIALEYTERPEAVAAALRDMRRDVDRSELQHLRAGRLVWQIGRTPGATRELKRRIRTGLRRLATAMGRSPEVTISLAEAWPAGIREAEGLSLAEGWGRWTDGDRVLIRLEPDVGTPSALRLEIREVFESNVGKPLGIRVGNTAIVRKLRRGRQRVRVKLRGPQGPEASRIEVRIPAPASPRSFGYNDDPRRLGIALTAVCVQVRATSSGRRT